MKKVVINVFSIKEKMPEKSGDNFLVFTRNDKGSLKRIYHTAYSNRYKAFNVDDNFSKEAVEKCRFKNVAFWAEIPNIENIQDEFEIEVDNDEDEKYLIYRHLV